MSTARAMDDATSVLPDLPPPSPPPDPVVRVTPARAAAARRRLTATAVTTLAMAAVAVAGLVVATDRPAAAGISLGVAPGPDPAVEVRNGGAAAFSGTLVVEGRETPLRLAPGRSRTVPIDPAGGCRGTAEVRLSGPGAPKGAVAVPCPTGATR